MNRHGDAASCAALAGLLRAAARELTAAAAGTARPDDDAAGVTDLTRALTSLADALTAFATGVRDPRPPRSGRPHPHTALRTACREVVEALEVGVDGMGRPPTAGSPGAGSQSPR